MGQTPIFTIGYGARNMDAFVAALGKYAIAYLIDVRSKPYSKFKPQFSKNNLQAFLPTQQIRYVYMGDLLGGQPDDPECYTNGKVDYKLCKQKAFFERGVQRVENAWRQDFRVALMCAEGKPQGCHRTKLVGEALVERGVTVQHIDESDQLQTHEDIMALISGGQLNLLTGVTQ